jgi:hypothetical protein
MARPWPQAQRGFHVMSGPAAAHIGLSSEMKLAEYWRMLPVLQSLRKVSRTLRTVALCSYISTKIT